MPLRWLLASLAARRARLALSLLAVAVGITVATALATLALRIGDDVARALRAAGPNFVVLPAGARWTSEVGADLTVARAGLVLRDTSVAGLKRSFWRNNVLQAAPELAMRATLGGRGATVIGTWFERDVIAGGEPWRTGLAGLRPNWGVQGRWPSGDAAEVALGATLARRLDLAPGRHVALAAGSHRERWLVTAVVEAGGREDDLAWAPLERVQRLTGRSGEVDRVWLSALVRPAPPGPAPDPLRDPEGYERYMCAAYPGNVAKDLAGRLGADVVPASDAVAGEAHVVGRLHLLMLLLALAALAASVWPAKTRQ